MNANDLTTIEQFLDRALPDAYRASMLDYPLDPADFNSQIALYNDPLRVISYNKTLREGEFAEHWNADRFAIGCSPCGDAYFLDLTVLSPAVFARDHETMTISEEAPDLAAFIAQQKSYEEAWRNRKQTAPKPWWKFW